MFKKIYNYIKKFMKEEYKFLIFMLLLYIILTFPVNYYITTGGGISDVSSRIDVEDKYNSKGSFNISYVTQLDGCVYSYLLSYIIPSWKKESTSNYKYTESESLEDIQFRSDLDLLTANENATYWAYTLADKKIEKTATKLYVITVFNEEFKTNLKVQDQILSIDGNSYDTIEEYKDYLQTKNKDDQVEVKVIRKNKEKTITTRLHEEEGRIILGVGLQYLREYKTAPKVDIHFKTIESGPSGGLITTLEIYNQLTKKDLTKGYKIAGTGTIEEDGTIGPIGGIEYKILGASQAKADYFLAPTGENYNDAKKYKEENNLEIKIIEVKTIQDAIEKLEGLD